MLPDSPDAATDHAEPRGGAVQRTRPPAFGTITAQSGRRNSVIAALNFTGGFSAVRQRIRRGEGQAEPWIILTDLEPMEAGASWREMRFWIETGFKALKSVGWQWQKTRRTDPARVERHWLVLSVATLLTLAFGNRVEDANALKRNPSALRAQPSRERVSPWHGDAEPPFAKGRMRRRAAAARTAAASAGGRDGRLPPRNPKPATASPSGRARMRALRAQARLCGRGRPRSLGIQTQP